MRDLIQIPPKLAASATIVAGGLLFLAGCGAPVAHFRPNEVYRLKAEKANDQPFSAQQKGDLSNTLTALWGTPDNPHAPKLADVPTAEVIDEGKLRLAAGPVASDKSGKATGLYREHCAHCHGITGDGQGPTAVALNPYPRDFRRGIFKFKSTPIGQKPTHADLVKIVKDGVPGTAMPSFHLLDEGEIDALVNYVKYLSLRGEVERKQYDRINELDPKARLIDLGLKETKPADLTTQLDNFKEPVANLVKQWQSAQEQVTPIPPRPEGWNDPETLAASVERGRDLFYTIAGCSKCHGDSALGDGQATDFDEWAKEIEPTKPELMREYLAEGAFRPRNAKPRNLRLGQYRGGRRPIDLYWRIHNGIEGTPMPKPPIRVEGDAPEAVKLTPEDIWSLVDYVRAMPNESISRPPARKVENPREHL